MRWSVLLRALAAIVMLGVSNADKRPCRLCQLLSTPQPTVENPCAYLHPVHLEASFVKEDACFSRRQVQQIITDLVLDASAAFERYNLTYFLDSGTLLGSYRTGSVIPYDQDADMGIDTRSLEFMRNNPIPLPSKYELHVLDSAIHPSGTRFKELPAKIVHKESALYLDIFVYLDSIDQATGAKQTGPLPSGCFTGCRSCPTTAPGSFSFQVPYDWIYPLRPCRFAGHTLKCPAQPEEYLRYMYGGDYMTPN